MGAKKKELNLQKRLILLDDLSISMIGSDFTRGEVPPTLTLPLRGGRGGWGRTNHVLFYATLRSTEQYFYLRVGPLPTSTLERSRSGLWPVQRPPLRRK